MSRLSIVSGGIRLGAFRGSCYPRVCAKVCTPRHVPRSGKQVALRPMAKASADAGAGNSEPGADVEKDQQVNLYRRAKVLMKKNQRGITAAINGAVVLGVATGASYGLLEVDWDIARGWTLTEFLLNTAVDDFGAYQTAASSDPIFTKACTSGVAYLLGDFAAQTFQGRTIFDLDLTRTLRSGIAGFCIHGPFCHLWIEWMEGNLSFDGAWYSTFIKVAADQTGWSIFLNTAYTSAILLMQGKGPDYIKDEVKATWWPAISSGWRFWPFVHMISFSPFIPTDLKLLFIDTMEIIWVTILATVVNRKDADTTPALSCSIDPAAAASVPYAAIEMTKNQFQPVIQKSDGTSEFVVLDDEARAELQKMSEAADAAYLLSSMQEDDIQVLEDLQEFQAQALKSIDELPSFDEEDSSLAISSSTSTELSDKK